MTEPAKAPKKAATSRAKSAKQEAAPEAAELMTLMRSLQQDLAKIKGEPGVENRIVKRTDREMALRSFHSRFVGICSRNRVEPVAAYPFICRIAKQYGLAAADEALRMAEELCNTGSPEGMIVSAAMKNFDETEGEIDDAQYLDAKAQEKIWLSSGANPLSTPSEAFLVDLVKPYTHRRVTVLSRLEYLTLVKNFCMERSAEYDFMRVLNYFDALIAATTELHRCIHQPSDAPPIDLSLLKIRENA